MFERHNLTSGARGAVPIVALALLLAGCAAANKTTSTVASSAGSGSSSSQRSSTGSGGMAGMNMGASGATGKAMSVNGIRPVPTQTLGTADWQGMKIMARAMTAVPFVIYNGTKEQMVKPGPKASFHLMVFLSDAQTGVVIPYASVWATITKESRLSE